MKKNNTAVPVNDPAYPVGSITCSIDLAALRKLSMRELWALREAIRTTDDVITGLRCQPRFNEKMQNGIHEPNRAGDLLETLNEWLRNYVDAIVNVAKEEKPKTGDEVEWRGHLLVGYLAGMTDSLAEIAALATDVAGDESRARARDSRARAAA